MTDEDYDKIIEELEAELAEYKHVASAIDKQWAESQDEIADLKDKLTESDNEVKNLRKALEIYERERNRFRHAKPEMTGAYFLTGGHGDKDENGVPMYVEICPAYGCGWTYIYEKTDKTIMYEGS